VESLATDFKVENAEDYPKNLKAFIKWAEPTYLLEMSLMGFNQMVKPTGLNNATGFMRKTAYGRQTVVFEYAGAYPYFGANFSFYIFCDLVNVIYKKFNFGNFTDDMIAMISLSIITDLRLYKRKPVFEGSISDDVFLIKDNIVTILDQAMDIKGLDKLLNGDILSDRAREWLKPMCPQRLILAWLANNNRFESLCVEFLSYDYWGINEFSRRNGEIERLLNYLRTDVKPLVATE